MTANEQHISGKKKATKDVDGLLERLLTLVALLRNARHKEKLSELEFLMVNQTFNLVSYRQCVLWEWNGRSVTIKAASGLADIDTDGPYLLWLKAVIEDALERKVLEAPAAEDVKVVGEEGQESFVVIVPVEKKDCRDGDAAEWEKWLAPYALLVAMKDAKGQIMNGLWLDRNKPFEKLEKAVLDDLGDGYSYILQHFDRRKKKTQGGIASFFSWRHSGIKKLLLLFLIVMCFPVRMNAIAPAEVVARNPFVVSVPFDGVIETVDVLPGQPVIKGERLVQMDSTMLRNEVALSTSEMLAAELVLDKTEREAMADREKLAEIAVLQAQLEQKKTQKAFAEELLKRAEVKAERDGIVIFSDPNALRGKPVQTGEQIMFLADPEDSELLIRVPVKSMIKVNSDIPAKFFLNVSPLEASYVSYETIGYQATMDPDGLMTYKIRAKFDDMDKTPRIGWTGTARVYGGHTILGFNILRRPLVTLRRKLGI